MKQVPFLFEVEPDAKVSELTHASFLNWTTLNREKTAKRQLNNKGYSMAYFFYLLWKMLFFKNKIKKQSWYIYLPFPSLWLAKLPCLEPAVILYSTSALILVMTRLRMSTWKSPSCIVSPFIVKHRLMI